MRKKKLNKLFENSKLSQGDQFPNWLVKLENYKRIRCYDRNGKLPQIVVHGQNYEMHPILSDILTSIAEDLAAMTVKIMKHKLVNEDVGKKVDNFGLIGAEIVENNREVSNSREPMLCIEAGLAREYSQVLIERLDFIWKSEFKNKIVDLDLEITAMSRKEWDKLDFTGALLIYYHGKPYKSIRAQVSKLVKSRKLCAVAVVKPAKLSSNMFITLLCEFNNRVRPVDEDDIRNFLGCIAERLVHGEK